MLREIPTVEKMMYRYSRGVKVPFLPVTPLYAVNPRKLNRKLGGKEMKKIVSNLLNCVSWYSILSSVKDHLQSRWWFPSQKEAFSKGGGFLLAVKSYAITEDGRTTVEEIKKGMSSAWAVFFHTTIKRIKNSMINVRIVFIINYD